jgi:hypothetical protein
MSQSCPIHMMFLIVRKSGHVVLCFTEKRVLSCKSRHVHVILPFFNTVHGEAPVISSPQEKQTTLILTTAAPGEHCKKVTP